MPANEETSKDKEGDELMEVTRELYNTEAVSEEVNTGLIRTMTTSIGGVEKRLKELNMKPNTEKRSLQE